MDTAFENRVADLVRQKDVSRERRRFGTASGASVLLAAGVVLLAAAFSSSAAESGFSAYLSLFVSDTSNVIAHFGDFALSLAESAPVFLLALFFFALAGIGYAAQKASRALRRAHFNYLKLS